MLWLQIFALVALAGHHRASGKEHSEIHTRIPRYSIYHNSFPYHYITDNQYTSAVVSRKAGPLCSGLHIAEEWILTVASCVYRHPVSDLFVITKAKNISTEHLKKYDYLPALTMFVSKTLALLRVQKPLYDVPILKLPSLGSSETEAKSQVYITKFHYHEGKKAMDSHMLPVQAKFNLNECTEKYETIPLNSYYCVNLVEKTPHSYGLFDLGTPLTYKYQGEDYLMGIFTAAEYPVFNNFKTYYLYENIWPAIEFISSHTKLDN